ncbi:polyadenylate-binding cytoplasmic and nuclear [Stylonychia lemnae]|uniref:Polyadenylate-binding cytoplasmic and nuclear n=1 Tax=Stylonychia lemnae TaxID=5949 RepID=A0A078AKI5_STYLE|nr:polyadenylate-binding cytoplasmic and nuclear [Stylonychia lemnae]|eukprot:CDW81947.1 polyadenylate-binding cytoplasmic and nuclear [Stylonychia lemnae]
MDYSGRIQLIFLGIHLTQISPKSLKKLALVRLSSKVTKAFETYRYPIIRGKCSRILEYSLKLTKAPCKDMPYDLQDSYLFVKGFQSLNWTHQNLYDNFKVFGDIVSCKVSIDKDHNCKGYGYIQMKDQNAAKQAIVQVTFQQKLKTMQMNGKEIEESALHVSKYDITKKSQLKSQGFNNLYIKNFPTPDFDDQDLIVRHVSQTSIQTLFSKYGKIANAQVMKDQFNKSKGFGFVSFQNSTDAVKALQENSINGLYVCEAKTKEQRQQELQRQTLGFKKSMMYLNLYVKGFNNLETTEDDLRQYFSAFGELRNLKINPNGYAYVCYKDREHARRAKEQAPQIPLNGQRLTVLFFEPKELRSLQIEEQMDMKQYNQKKYLDKLNTPISELQRTNEVTGVFDLISNLGRILDFSQKHPVQNQNFYNQGQRMVKPWSRQNGNQQQQNPQQRVVNAPQMQNFHRKPLGQLNNSQANERVATNPDKIKPAMNYYPQQLPMHIPMPLPMPIPLPPSQLMMNMNPVTSYPLQGLSFPMSSSNQTQPQLQMPEQSQNDVLESYNNMMFEMFKSEEFKSADTKKRKELIGNNIYETVERLAGIDKAPKITGMLIDLQEFELNKAVATLQNLEQKVTMASQMLKKNEEQLKGSPSITTPEKITQFKFSSPTLK